MITKQVLIMMLGHPGSGKSYFTKQLAPIIHAVRFNGDHMRTSMFDNPEDIANRANNPRVFGAINYAVHETLKAGYSAIYDAQHNKVAERERSKSIASQFDVPAILVWIKTPLEIAVQRGQDRLEAPDQRQKTEEHMRGSIERFMKALEKPVTGELCIIIDGTQPFEEQFKSYQEQMRRLKLT